MVLAVEKMLERESRKIRKEGIQEGIKEGIKEGINKTIKEMLLLKTDDNFIKKVTGINDKELEKIKKELLEV